MICLAAFLLQDLTAYAETRYVSDQLYITLRSGKSQQHQIIKTLKTDTPLEILGDSDGKYVKARTRDGKTGYVLKQYLTEKKPKYMIINRLKREKETAEQKIETLKTRIDKLENKLTSQKGEYREKLEKLGEKNNALGNQLAASRNELAELKKTYNDLRRQSGNLESIISERNKLRNRNDFLASEVQKLENSNAKLKNLAIIKWFLAGGGVFLIGWLIGRTPRRKKITW